jgi:hypothetical protein
MKIIGISGKIGCGKSELAKKLLSIMPFAFFRFGFGDALKETCSKLFNYPLEWNYSEEGKNKLARYPYYLASSFPDLIKYDEPQLTPVRRILQHYATEVIRKQFPDYWVDTVFNKAANEEVNYLLIDDVRFKNEAERIKNYGGVLIRLDPYIGWEPGKHADHQSEIDLDDYSYFNVRIAPEFGDLDNTACLVKEVFLRMN